MLTNLALLLVRQKFVQNLTSQKPSASCPDLNSHATKKRTSSMAIALTETNQKTIIAPFRQSLKSNESALLLNIWQKLTKSGQSGQVTRQVFLKLVQQSALSHHAFAIKTTENTHKDVHSLCLAHGKYLKHLITDCLLLLNGQGKHSEMLAVDSIGQQHSYFCQTSTRHFISRQIWDDFGVAFTESFGGFGLGFGHRLANRSWGTFCAVLTDQLVEGYLRGVSVRRRLSTQLHATATALRLGKRWYRIVQQRKQLRILECAPPVRTSKSRLSVVDDDFDTESITANREITETVIMAI